MKTGRALLATAVLWLVGALSFAQSPVPPLVKFGGVIPGPQGATAATFALYAEPTGGAPIWTETQTVMLDAAGRYSVVLGATRPEGLPTILFGAGEPRWVAVQVDGQADLPRTALVSVPYALKAADAETIGGKPLSAFVLAGERTGIGADGLTYVDTRLLQRALNAPAGGAAQAVNGTPGHLPAFGSTGTDLVNSSLYQASNSAVGLNTVAPEAPLHVVSSSAPAAFFDVFSNALTALPVIYRAARGSSASPAPVQTDDILGGLAVRGYTPTGFSGGRGQVMFKAAEPWTAQANGTYLQFTTTPTGSATYVERMRIAPNGYVGVGAGAPQFPLDVRPARGATHARFGPDSGVPLFLTGNQPVIGFNTYAEGGWRYGAAGAAAYLAFSSTTGSLTFGTAPAGNADALASVTPRMTIANDGKVSIATTATTHQLTVGGPISSTNSLAGVNSQIINYAQNGTGLLVQADNGSSAWALSATSAQGVAINAHADSAAGYAGQFGNSAPAGTALRALVAGTEVMKVDASGIHAGPAMSGTPIAMGHVELGVLQGHSANVSFHRVSTGSYEITIAGETALSDYSHVVSIMISHARGTIVNALWGTYMQVETFLPGSSDVYADLSFSFVVYKI